MTEEEWLASPIFCGQMRFVGKDNPPFVYKVMFLQGKASDRKLRLFACACCRRVWHLLHDERSRNAVEVAERFADGQATHVELQFSHAEAENADADAVRAAEASAAAAGRQHRISDDFRPFRLHWAVSVLADSSAHVSALNAWSEVGCAVGVKEEAIQTQLLHCIFGNPFRPVTVSPAWQTANVVSLAQVIYDDRRFVDLPILADALEEAGCTNGEILAHCRGDGPHVRGCWVMDLILGKS